MRRDLNLEFDHFTYCDECECYSFCRYDLKTDEVICDPCGHRGLCLHVIDYEALIQFVAKINWYIRGDKLHNQEMMRHFNMEHINATVDAINAKPELTGDVIIDLEEGPETIDSLIDRFEFALGEPQVKVFYEFERLIEKTAETNDPTSFLRRFDFD